MSLRIPIHLLFLVLGLLAWAAGPGPARADEEPPKPPPPPGERDPFSPSERIREEAGAGQAPRFVPREELDAVPPLALRGYVEDAAGQAVALLEVAKGQTYLVRAGDTVSLPHQGRNTVIRVLEVGNLALRVEVGELRREVVVR